jgi:hemolysin activation/secretion protein
MTKFILNPSNLGSRKLFLPFPLTGIFLVCICLLSSFGAQAQIGAGALQQGLEREFPTPSPLALPEARPKREDLPRSSDDKAVRLNVKSFILEGVNKLPEAEVQQVLSKWVGKSVDFNDLQDACDAVVQLYRAKGMTVQAILPPQKIADGQVRIRVTEAKLSNVIIELPDGKNIATKEKVAEFITYANPIGDVLNMDKLSRAIIILNENPGIAAAASLEPGENDGETAVKVQLSPVPAYQGRAELNNYGSRYTGANQALFAVNLLSPVGFGQQLSINGVGSAGSAYGQLNYSLPITASGLRVGANATALNYRTVSNYQGYGNPIGSYGGGNPNGSYGSAWTAGVNAAYPLIRSTTSNLNVIVAYDIKSYNNKSQVTNTTTSDYSINNISLGVAGNHIDNFGGQGINNYSANLVSGTFTVNNYIQGGFGTYTPANFGKFTFAVNREQSLTSSGNTSLYAALSGQLANVNLNQAEQFYLGGPYGIRAYPVSQSPGSQGALATIELRHQLPRDFSISAFFDAGTVQQYKSNYDVLKGQTNAPNVYTLMGTGLGVKWSHGNWRLSGAIAWQVGSNPLYSYTGQQVNVDGTNTDPRGWFTASYSF